MKYGILVIRVNEEVHVLTPWCCSYSSSLVELVDLTWYLRKDMGIMASVGLGRGGFEVREMDLE